MANVDIGPADNIQMELTSGSAIVEAWLPGLVLQSRLNTHHIYTDVSVALFFHSLAAFSSWLPLISQRWPFMGMARSENTRKKKKRVAGFFKKTKTEKKKEIDITASC